MRRVYQSAWVLIASFFPCLAACSPAATDVARDGESHDASSGGRGAGGTTSAGGSFSVAGAAAIGGALNQAGAAQAGSSSFGGHAGMTLGESGGNGAAAGGGVGGAAGHGGASGSAGVAGNGGLGGWGGGAGSAGNGGHSGVGNGEYCAPCVTSSDCATDSYCIGGVNPRCGKACTVDADCTVGTATSTCELISLGGGAATPVGGGATPIHGGAAAPSAALGIQSCTPADDVCGTAQTSAVLTCTDTWANYAQNFFATTCIGSCHRHDQTFPSVTAVRNLADAIRSEVETGAMPAGTTLPQADRLRLLTWLACGAP